MDHILASKLQPANFIKNDEERGSCSATRLIVGKRTVINFRIRLLLFCLIEAGFIALASVFSRAIVPQVRIQ